MSCASIMTKDALVLDAGETVADAARKLIVSRHTSLPVVDGKGCYVGMFGIYDLLGMLVPRIALAGDLSANLRFISDNPKELRAHYREISTRRVGDAAERSAATLRPDMSEIEAIRLFCQSYSSLAVVDPQSRSVLGMVSCWDAIRAIAAPSP